MAALLAAAFALVSCGAGGPSPGTSASGSPVSSATFHSSDYRFSVAYDPHLFRAAAETAAVGNLDWTVWPVALGSPMPEITSLPYFVGIDAYAGTTPDALAGEAAAQRQEAKRYAGGTYRRVSLGGANGWRTQWTDVSDQGQRYVLVTYGLSRGANVYRLVIHCRLSDWRSRRAALEAIVNSFTTT